MQNATYSTLLILQVPTGTAINDKATTASKIFSV